jgi:hypothetical protein
MNTCFRFQDTGNLTLYTVPSHAPTLSKYDNIFGVKAIYEVIPGQGIVFSAGKIYLLENSLG